MKVGVSPGVDRRAGRAGYLTRRISNRGAEMGEPVGVSGGLRLRRVERSLGWIVGPAERGVTVSRAAEESAPSGV